MKKVDGWIDSRVEVQPSPIHGKGAFANQPIKQGEVIMVWSGLLFTQEDIEAGRAKKHGWYCTTVDKDLYLGAADLDASDFMNHSCDPNVWMQADVTDEEFILVARRDIEAREELTIDYALFEGDENWVLRSECHCGSTICRQTITGRDWRLPELQTRYQNHFSPFINRRINTLSL